MKFTYPERDQFSADYFEQFNGNRTELGERPLVKKFAKRHSDRLDSVYRHNAIEYAGLAAMGTDEMFDLMLKMGKRKPRRLRWFIEKTGKDPEYLTELLQHMAETGLIEYDWDNDDHEKQYYVPPYVEGIGEWSVINARRLESHPELAEFFTNNTFMPITQIARMAAPGGGGVGMHVIPVQKAIEHTRSTIDIERISYWLDKYHTFCLAPCACRNARRARGEGSPEDANWCIFLGEFADYMMETKKGIRYLTKEEALEICRMAEDLGFVHQVSNQDGKDKVFVLCNCNIESCYALRTSQLFNAPNLSASSFRARVTADKCTACGQCVEACPAGAAKLGQKLCTKDGPVRYPVADLPDNNRWGADRWDYEYRDHAQIQVYDSGTAPCKSACPAHIGVQGYLKLAAQGRYDEALALIKRDNPFPAVCGRVCDRRCEDVCTRAQVDDPVAIDEVKRFLAERELDAATRHVPKKRYGNVKEVGHDEKIAIIGAGPAGLTCAYYLALWGYEPTVFEKEAKPGGMMTYGVPSFRLEKDVVAAEIDAIKALGVDIRCGVEVGRDITIQALRERGYLAFYVAIGLQDGGRLDARGADATGVTSGVDFMRMVNDDEAQACRLGGKVVVIGGGSIGADVARTAARCGAESVDLYSRRDFGDMTMSDEERAECERDGVVIHAGWGRPEVFGNESGECSSIVFHKRVSDSEFDDNETTGQECSTVLYCIGQRASWGGLHAGTRIKLNPDGTVQADPKTYQTAEPDVFVGGDVFSGRGYVIDAIAAGRIGADSLRRYVQKGVNMTTGRDWRELKELDGTCVQIPDHVETPRQPSSIDEDLASREPFRDARRTFSEEQVRMEAARCLSCGATVVDENKCIGCGLCTTRCAFDAIQLYRTHPENSNMVPYEKRFIADIGHQIKRIGSIVASDIRKTVARRGGGDS